MKLRTKIYTDKEIALAVLFIKERQTFCALEQIGNIFILEYIEFE